MYGEDIYDDNTKGIIPRLINDIFNYVENVDENITFQFKLSILQIYKENIYDLLTGENNLKIKENPIKGIYVDKLTEVYIDSFETFMEYVDLAQENRIVSETKLNSYSSRSHSILIFEVTQNLNNANFSKKGTLNLVDLAGSEKISKTGAVGETLEEAKKINLSLSALGNVIHALTSNSDHIPYRDSKLTRILQESLGGNFKTSLIVTCSPHSYHFEETTSSLKFAQRVKHIKNKVKINIKLTYEELQKIISQLRKQLGYAKIENQKLREIMAENGIECTIENMFEEENKGKNNDSDSDSEKEEKEKKGFSKTGKFENKNVLENVNKIEGDNNNNINISDNNININNKENLKTDIKEKENLISKTLKNSYISNHLSNNDDDVDSKNCIEHNKIIRELKKKIEDLNFEIKEKDNIISTLEESNKMKQKQIESHKESSNIFSSNSNDIPKMLRDIQDMYDEINEKIINIQGHYDILNNNKYIEDLIEQFSKVVSEINLNNEKNKNKDIECFKGLSSILSELLNKYNLKESIDQNLTNLNNKYEQNVNLLFDNVISNNSNSKNKLINYSTLFIYLFCESYINLYFYSEINKKVLSHNNLLSEANSVLIKISEDLLKSNLEISNKLNNADMDKITKNLMKIPFGNDSLKLSFSESNQQPQYFRHNNRKRSKIMSVINRKGLDILRKQRKENIFDKEKIQYQYRKNSIIEKDENDENEENKDEKNEIEINTKDEKIHHHKNYSTDNDKNKEQKIVIQISDTEVFQKKQEKKKSKLTMLKEYIVRAFKETEEYKKDMKILKISFIKLLNEQLEIILKKLSNNNIINKVELKEIEKIIQEQDIEKVIKNTIKIEDKKNKINQNKENLENNDFNEDEEKEFNSEEEEKETINEEDNEIKKEKEITEKEIKKEKEKEIIKEIDIKKEKEKEITKEKEIKKEKENEIIKEKEIIKENDNKNHNDNKNRKKSEKENKAKKVQKKINEIILTENSENKNPNYNIRKSIKNNSKKNINNSIQNNNPKKDIKSKLFKSEIVPLSLENINTETNLNQNNSNSKTIFGNLKSKNEKEIKLYPNTSINNSLNVFSDYNNNKLKNKINNISERKKFLNSDNFSKFSYDTNNNNNNNKNNNINNNIFTHSNKNSEPLSPINNVLNNYPHFNFSSPRNHSNQSVSSIEDIVDDYLNTGTATRRFDGIGITIKNHKIKCLFRGGLSANNSLDITPIGTHIKSLMGDDFIPNPD